MFRLFYDIPFCELCFGMILSYAVWCFGSIRFAHTKRWKMVHWGLVLLWFCAFSYITLFSRSTGNGAVNMTPFWSYRIAFQKGNYDYFQQIYLNVFAFIFFGLLAPELFKCKTRYWIVVGSAILLSLAIECSQFYLDVGLAEVDDVFSNTLGAVIGIFTNHVAYCYIKNLK